MYFFINMSQISHMVFSLIKIKIIKIKYKHCNVTANVNININITVCFIFYSKSFYTGLFVLLCLLLKGRPLKQSQSHNLRLLLGNLRFHAVPPTGRKEMTQSQVHISSKNSFI